MIKCFKYDHDIKYKALLTFFNIFLNISEHIFSQTRRVKPKMA